MPATAYNRDVSAFLNSKYNAGKLDNEISSSSIVHVLDIISDDFGSGGTTVTLTFKDTLSAGDEATLDAVIAAHDGESVAEQAIPVAIRAADGTDMKSLSGRQRVVVEKPDNTGVTIYSHDWTDPTTWVEGAIRAVDETPIRVTDRKFRLYNDNIIDNYHGKISQEDFLRDGAGNSFRLSITVDSVPKAEDNPHLGIGNGDYWVNYASGMVYFHEDVAGGADVKVTYHYATDSHILVTPTDGTILRVELVEVQFSKDIDIRDTAIFQPEGYVAAFAEGLVGAPDGTAGVFAIGGATGAGDTLAPTDRIALGNPVMYKSMRDYQNDALRSYPAYPPMGGSSWRGMPQEVIVLDWDYLRSKPLSSAAGMRIRVCLQHDMPFGGSYATATFYCGSDPEDGG
jgi:hypothetical protein